MQKYGQIARNSTQYSQYVSDQKRLEATFREGYVRGLRVAKRHQLRKHKSRVDFGLRHLLCTLLAISVGVGLGTALSSSTKKQSASHSICLLVSKIKV
jgi:hypothetical protein